MVTYYRGEDRKILASVYDTIVYHEIGSVIGLHGRSMVVYQRLDEVVTGGVIVTYFLRDA